MPIGAATISEISTRKNVPISGAQMPPAVMWSRGLGVRKSSDSAGQAL